MPFCVAPIKGAADFWNILEVNGMKSRMVGLVSLAVLAGAFLVVRFPLLFFHGMKEWPLDLFAAGAVIIALSGIILGAKRLPALTAAGYILGFVAGSVFRWDSTLGYDNLWIIWTGVFLVLILAGVVAEFLAYKRRKTPPPQ